MKNSCSSCWVLGCAVLLLPAKLFATGGFYFEDVLDNGGSAVETAPEFYWADLVTELSRGFRPKEKAVVPCSAPSPGDSSVPQERDRTCPLDSETRARFTAEQDAADYADAINTGRLKVRDPAVAKNAHAEQRSALLQLSSVSDDPATVSQDGGFSRVAEVPEDFATGGSEFDLYNRGAYAYRIGNDEVAKKNWQELLALKRGERTYRSTWATYMLARLAMRQKDWAAAADYFARVRALAADGFKDSLGFAAESYGWQARCELEMGDKDEAAKLYLTQLALGDGTAITSLKKCLPTKRPEDVRAEGYFDPDAMAGAALDPTRRQLVTAFVLSNLASEFSPYYYGNDTLVNDCDRWLDILEKHGLSLGENSGWAAWIAYSNGNYEQAARWAALSPENDAPSQWVRSKIAARKGDFQQAAALLEKVRTSRWLKEYETSKDGLIPKYASFYALSPDGYAGVDYNSYVDSWPNCVREELGASLLASSHFVEAERLLRLSGNSRGAAYIRENLFTTDQHITWLREIQKLDLKQLFPDRTFPQDEGDFAATERRAQLAESRSEVGRRLAREARFKEARAYLSAGEKKQLDAYEDVLRRAEEKNLPPEEMAYRKYAAARFTAEARGGFLYSPEAEELAFPRALASSELQVDAMKIHPRPGILEERRNSQFLDGDHFSKVFVPVGRAERSKLSAWETTSPLSYYTTKEFDLFLRAASLLPEGSPEREEAFASAFWVVASYYPESLEFRKTQQLVSFLRESRPGLTEEDATSELGRIRERLGGWPEGAFNQRYTKEFPQTAPEA